MGYCCKPLNSVSVNWPLRTASETRELATQSKYWDRDGSINACLGYSKISLADIFIDLSGQDA
eukprot:4774378-Ditylum_brightwellii.AAC.1